jgi:2-polyprenyl-3-methyl-5-hydroxy-6-metoxy-1,4-benzoquinol methylase
MKIKYDEEKSRCPLCLSEKITPYHLDFRGNKFSICETCGIQFLNPQYTDEYLNEYYSKYTEPLDEKWYEPLEYGHNYYMSIIERFMKVGSMLDYGCGNGVLSRVAKDRGWDVEGYDVDCETTERVSEEIGIRVQCGDVVSLAKEWGENRFDLITMHQVIEHLKDPVKIINELTKCLKPNGIIFVAVPNIRSFSASYKFFLEKKGLRKKNIGKYYDADHHLFYFKPDVMKNFLARNGYEVLYTTGCHKVRPGLSKVKRFINKYT